MAKKITTDNIEELFVRHDSSSDKEAEKGDKEKIVTTEKVTEPPEPGQPKQEKKEEEASAKNTEAEEQPVAAKPKPKKKPASRRSSQSKKPAVTNTAIREQPEEPQVFINRTYSISRKIVNAITDYAYHNKIDKNTIVNTALKDFLGDYYEEAES